MRLLLLLFLPALRGAARREAVALDPAGEHMSVHNTSTFPLDSIHTMVISLPGSDRLAGFVRAARGASLQQICRTPGINASAVSDMPRSLMDESSWQQAKELSSTHAPLQATLLNVNTVGLTLAHARAWQTVLDFGWPMAIVAEDDVRFYAPAFSRELERAVAFVLKQPEPDRLDLLQLQLDNPQTKEYGDWPKPTQPMTESQALATRDQQSTTIVPGQSGYNFGMYLITKRGAQRALAAVLPVQQLQLDHPDGVLRSSGGSVNLGMTVPPIAQCADLGSIAQKPMQALSLGDSVPDCDQDTGTADVMELIQKMTTAAALIHSEQADQ